MYVCEQLVVTTKAKSYLEEARHVMKWHSSVMNWWNAERGPYILMLSSVPVRLWGWTLDRQDACQQRMRTCKMAELSNPMGVAVVASLDEINERDEWVWVCGGGGE